MKRLFYVGQDDDISDLAGRLQSAAEGDEVALVVPSGALIFQSPLHLRLLRQLGARRGHGVVLVTADSRLQEQAREAGLGAFSSVPAFESGVPVGPQRAPLQPPGISPAGAGAPPSSLQPPGWPARAAPAGVPGGPGASAAPAPGGMPAVPGGRPRDPQPTGSAGAESLPPWARSTPTPPEARLGEWERNPAGAGPETTWSATHNGWPGSGRAGGEPLDWPAPAGGGPAGSGGPPLGWDAAGAAELAREDPIVAGGTATAVAPPPARPQAVAASERGVARPGPPSPPRRGGRWRPGAPLYFVLAGIAVVGILLYLALSPTALVTVTVAEQPLMVNPVIQGAAQAVAAGQSNQIQTRVVTSTQSQQFTATETGTKTIPAVAATGQVVLSLSPDSVCYTGTPPQPTPCYDSGGTFTVGQGQIFQTSGNPAVSFGVTQATNVVIPPKGGSSNPIPVQAETAGSSGNVSQGAISDWINCDSDPTGECQAEHFKITNQQATSGGTDPSQETVASSSDVQGWQNQVSQLCSQLITKAQSDLATKAAPGKIAQGPDQGGEAVSCGAKPDVTKVAAGDQMAQKSETVTVTASGQATVYNPADIEKVVYADLQRSNNLPQGDLLASTHPTLSSLDIIQAASDGTLSMSVTGTDFYRPAALNLSSVKDQLTGHNPADVPGIIEKQLGDVKSVTVSEHPFTLFYMPFFASNIQITERYVAPSAPSTAT
jgi:hypothetical protein